MTPYFKQSFDMATMKSDVVAMVVKRDRTPQFATGLPHRLAAPASPSKKI